MYADHHQNVDAKSKVKAELWRKSHGKYICGAIVVGNTGNPNVVSAKLIMKIKIQYVRYLCSCVLLSPFKRVFESERSAKTV